jgi:flagellar motility protein MotE (MotC chaperone)
MEKSKKPTMSRQEAYELYDDLQKAMTTMMAKKGRNLKDEIAKIQGAAGAAPQNSQPAAAAMKARLKAGMPRAATSAAGSNRGIKFALSLMFVFAAGRTTVSGLEWSGILTAQVAEASTMMVRPASDRFSREQINILTSLDQRRADLERKSREIDERKLEMDRRDGEFAVKLSELKDISSRLKTDREKDEKKRNSQIEQLANVYGSMNPPEAAQLMEQLDVSIALELIEKMPEKRIGQILALMNPERALAITRMLSGHRD